MEINLLRVDQSGVYALPSAYTADDIQEVRLNGEQTEYTVVKDGTEIDVPAARLDSIVTAILK